MEKLLKIGNVEIVETLALLLVVASVVLETTEPGPDVPLLRLVVERCVELCDVGCVELCED